MPTILMPTIPRRFRQVSLLSTFLSSFLLLHPNRAPSYLNNTGTAPPFPIPPPWFSPYAFRPPYPPPPGPFPSNFGPAMFSENAGHSSQLKAAPFPEDARNPTPSGPSLEGKRNIEDSIGTTGMLDRSTGDVEVDTNVGDNASVTEFGEGREGIETDVSGRGRGARSQEGEEERGRIRRRMRREEEERSPERSRFRAQLDVGAWNRRVMEGRGGGDGRRGGEEGRGPSAVSGGLKVGEGEPVRSGTLRGHVSRQEGEKVER